MLKIRYTGVEVVVCLFRREKRPENLTSGARVTASYGFGTIAFGIANSHRPTHSTRPSIDRRVVSGRAVWIGYNDRGAGGVWVQGGWLARWLWRVRRCRRCRARATSPAAERATAACISCTSSRCPRWSAAAGGWASRAERTSADRCRLTMRRTADRATTAQCAPVTHTHRERRLFCSEGSQKDNKSINTAVKHTRKVRSHRNAL